MKNKYSVVAMVVLNIIFAALPQRLGGQSANVSPILQNSRDIDALANRLLADDEDLEKMEPTLSGTELHSALEFDDKAALGSLELNAVSSVLVTYDRMQCEPDKQTVKDILKRRLASYSHLLNLEGDQVGGYLGFVTLPANAASGTRIRDDLRAAKNKLDEINASLN